MNHTPCLDFAAMKNVDIRTVNPATLVDIRETKIDPDKPQIECMLDCQRKPPAVPGVP